MTSWSIDDIIKWLVIHQLCAVIFRGGEEWRKIGNVLSVVVGWVQNLQLRDSWAVGEKTATI